MATTTILVVVVVVMYYLQRRTKGDIESHKTEFFSLAAHYFMTPLSIIRGVVEELQDPSTAQLPPSELQKRYATIQANASRLLLLIQNITTVSAIDQGELQLTVSPVDMVELIDNCVSEVHAEAASRNLTVRFDRPTDAAAYEARIDVEKFRQALLNVIGNAVKFTAAGGGVLIALRREGDQYIIQVSDNGIGIDHAEMSKLFTRFHRGTSYLNLDYEGVGLGLYIARFLIEANHGRIQIESRRGKGTLVTMIVPR